MYAYLSRIFSPSQVDNASYWIRFAVAMTAFIFLTVIVFGYAK